MSNQTLILVGFMGSGKTSVGYELSQALSIPFFDMDQVIVQREQQSIVSIFAEKSERYFRKLEAELLSELVLESGVVATGGGIISSLGTREQLKKQPVYWLKASFETIVNRVSQDKENRRPLFDSENLEGFKQLYEERQAYYREVASVVIEVDDLSVLEIVQFIRKQYCVI
ncbi:shikimate kinase [Vagococcus sp.]|uniref:shikimate kinase n=1 Tax=Vagococcus sp. TaxID=1933889 RepID=UPI003F988597